MFLVPRDLELSRRRAPDREAVLLYLALVGSASLGEVSEATGIRARRVVGIIEGARGEYAEDLSLRSQGAVSVDRSRIETRYSITCRGELAARMAADAAGLALG